MNSTVLLCDVQKEKEESEAEGNDGKKSSATVSLTTQASTHEKKHQDTSSNSSCSTNSAPELPLRDEEHLHQFRSCYICKRRYSKLHHFYHSLCELCAAHNWQKRMQTCDMTDRVCLVTGGRVKIGFQCCLKLLRCGARVICTSRFPVDAAKRFAIQQDFSVWKDRLFTIGLDLRDLAYLEFFCQHLYKTFPRLDVLINNACQTIRRPRWYYSHMLEDEVRVCKLARLGACDDINLIVSKEEEEEGEGGDLSFSSSERYVVSEEDGKQEHAHGGTAPTGESSKKKQKYVMEGSDIQTLLSLETNLREVYEEVNIDPTRLVTASSGEASQPLLPASPTSTSISTSTSPPLSSSSSSSRADTLPVLPPLTAAEMSQVPLTEEDRCILVGKGGGEGDHLLPANLRDVNNQQIDLRRKNSWLLRTDEVETPEVAEVFAINSISPFVLISKLKKLLMTGKKNFADDLISNSSPASNRERSRVQDSSRLKTLNEFILESLQRQESCGSGSGSGGRTEDDSWTKSAANHRGTNLAAVVAQNCSFIVNVSSMEGKFYRPKTVFHSHTNMAKAALNMLTRTASVDYQTSNIYMSAVDTGWINDENPLEKASRIAQTSNFCPPLDEVDAAARILDPIFTPLLSSQTEQHQDDNEEKGDQKGNDSGLCSPPFGCFLKDYHISEW